MLEQKLIDEVIAAWVLDQNAPLRDRKKKPIPNPSDVKEILEQAFLASIEREENKPITFSLAFLNKEDIEAERKLTSFQQLIVTFKEEVPFTSEGISKIASAFDPKISALIVGKSKIDGKFSIWGGMFFGQSLNHFNSIPVALSSHSFSRPDVLIVTAKTAGSLTISRGHSQIGTLSSGLFVRATPTPFVHKGLGEYVENIIKELKGYKTFGVHFYREYINALEYLLYQSSYRGHGSTIVILPCKLSSPPPLIIKYSFSERLQIENLIYESVNSNKDLLLQLAYIQKLSERLDFLAQLSVIDGALILSPDLEVVTFGATLNEPTPWRGSLITGPDGFSDGGELLALSKYGTRHNSAVQFAAVCKGCIVFVISQDGPIRAFTVKDDRTILCWPDCRNSMFI